MRVELLKRFTNIFLRGLSMGSRFILVFALAKLLTPAEVGLFGLMMATVSFMVLLLGGDYYTYSQRELLARPVGQWSFVIQHQIKAQLILYAILLPAQIFIFIFGFMDWRYVFYFFVLLVLEHIAQEINRLLIAMHKQLIASLILFIRMGSWVLVVIPLMFFYDEYRNLGSVYFSWMIGSAIAIIFGVFVISKAIPVWDKEPTDYRWLKKGFKIGGMFLVASLCFRGLLTFDRYAVENLGSLETLGVYVFYIGIVMGLYNFLDPAIFSFLYPKMLQSYQRHEKSNFHKIFRELVLSTILVSIFLAVIIWFLTPYIIRWIDKPIYTGNLTSLVYLIAAGFTYAVGHIPHYALYAMKRDKWIVAAHISAIIIFFIALAGFQLNNSIQTVSLALFVAFGWMGLVKAIGYGVARKNSPLFNGVE